MNTTKSWVCYLWLLTIDSLEELIDFASTLNPISRRETRLSGDGRSQKEESQLSGALGGRESRTVGLYG